MNYFLSPPDIDVLLSDSQSRKLAEIRVDESGRKEKLPLYYDGETISGKINVTLKSGKKLDHNGIKVEFIGLITFYNDRSNSLEFVSLSKELARPGELLHSHSFPFEFREAEKPYESYCGVNVKLRYFLRVTIAKKSILGTTTKEHDILVHAMSFYPAENQPTLKMDVGIEDALHIEFEYDKQKYHLKDVIVGKIYFLLVRIKIKSMEVQILRKETTNTVGTEAQDCVLKYEIMDGSPARGESIPLRLFLAGYDLQPTMRDIARRFSVRYFLNLVLTDEEERRYFKQQEIILWRRYDKYSRKFQQPPTTIPSALSTPQMSRNRGSQSLSNGKNSISNGDAADTKPEKNRDIIQNEPETAPSEESSPKEDKENSPQDCNIASDEPQSVPQEKLSADECEQIEESEKPPSLS